jgi:hypothetical protein
MAEMTKHFLASLTPEQKAKATYEFKHDERLNWHFIPKTRNGLPLKEMTPAQRHIAHALLSTALSQRGYMKASLIMSLEQVLKEIEVGGRMVRDAELYFVTIFGMPGGKEPWGWRWEGHHLACNFTVVNGTDVMVTPTFMGSNPAEVRDGPRTGLRVLAAEEDLARKLLLSFNEEQRRTAIYTNRAPSDIISGTNRPAMLLKPAGLAMGQMNQTQQTILMDLLKEYFYRARPEVAELDVKKVQALSPDKVTFAWAGPTEPKQGHYYRIQAPHFLIEYDNTQNNANHIHAVWRDLERDFGGDPLKKHYEEHHAK